MFSLSRPSPSSRSSQKNRFTPSFEDLEQRCNPATIDPTSAAYGEVAMGIYQTMMIDTPAVNNAGDPYDSNFVVQAFIFTDTGDMDVTFQLDNSSGTTQYGFMAYVINSTAIDWLGVNFQIGFGTGSEFVQSGSAGVAINTDSSTSSAVVPYNYTPTINAAASTIDFANFVQTAWECNTFNFQVSVADVDPNLVPESAIIRDPVTNAITGYEFTLRVTPRDTAEPPPPPPAPEVDPEIQNLAISYGTGHYVTVTGTVADNTPAGLTVQFSGVVSGSATTQSDGSFSFTAQASALGQIQIDVTDSASNSATSAYIAVANSTPVIQSFTITDTGEDNIWIFAGQVIDEHADGLQIALDGLASLTGVTITCDDDGYFWLSRMLNPGEEGLVAALTTDWWGMTSDVVYALV